MIVVRHRMIKPFLGLTLIPLLGILASCNPTELTGKNVKSNVITNDGSYDNKAFVYEDSPYILAGPKYGPAKVDMRSLLNPVAKVITPNNKLTSNCSMMFFGHEVTINDCIHSLGQQNGPTQPLARKPDRTYIFDTNSPEFYQTNTLYHLSQASSTFLKKLSFAYEKVQSLPHTKPKSIPYYLMNSQLFWFKAMSSIDRQLYNYDYITSYAQCEMERNAAFSPVGPEICFGKISDFPGFYYVQDPSVIYHELAHGFVSIMMNMRNGTSATNYHPLRSALGNYGYTEAGSINEGIADYFSFVMNKREHVGEFALGKTVGQSRPLSEADPMHIKGVDETSEGRLSYPQFLHYDPNEPDAMIEDVHYAGQIITHYLVALTKNLKKHCSLKSDKDGGHNRATSYVMLLLAETLSELGDLNARGIDNYTIPLTGPYYFTNLDPVNSYLWSQVVNGVNYRKFSQVMAKNIYKYITGNLCEGFDKNKSEKLMDDYGLLLFKSYNDNGKSTKDALANYKTAINYMDYPILTPVSENNRRKSVLVSKQLLSLAEKTNSHPTRVNFYVIDNYSDISGLLQSLLFKGYTVPLSKDVAGTEYNNNNIRVSPGEVVAVIPNLLNNSNSPMAGVQLLATDWDHVAFDENTGNFKPCVVDSVTTVDQGAQEGGSCDTVETDYNRSIGKKRADGKFHTNLVAPVCMVQLDDGESSRWVSQNEFRKKQGLALMDKDCLGYSANGSSDQDFTFNPHECLVRFLPGVNNANFSRIDPQKTYYETVIKESKVKSFNPGNLLMMEVNKWIPPGTKFRCRLRARFSNCSDCYTDGANGDYIDAEYNGDKPFQVLNFEFDVNE